jgi:NAD(P)-dependent dehydrogenase (short-subunit alcohol dehydrogenase family)
MSSPPRSTRFQTEGQHSRAGLPQLRKQKKGLVVWVSSSSCAGGTPPYLAPYFAAKAGMDALAVVYSRELTRWGIETSIIFPAPSLVARTTLRTPVLQRTKRGSLSMKRVLIKDKGFADDVLNGFSSIVPPDAMSRALRTLSSRWSMLPLASDRSVCTTIQPRTGRKWSIWFWTASVPSFAGSASPTY